VYAISSFFHNVQPRQHTRVEGPPRNASAYLQKDGAGGMEAAKDELTEQRFLRMK